MVDVGDKRVTSRVAIAACRAHVNDTVLSKLLDNSIAKGNVLTVAQVAGVCGAKATSTLIPLCHNIPISSVKIHLALNEASKCVEVCAMVKTDGTTGVEMEAMTACSITALTVYDMVKAVDKRVRITDLRLLFKSGGKSGTFFAEPKESIVQYLETFGQGMEQIVHKYS
eukprot:m.354782 g.354782  ORF g.354782 m.354782 type:complete len:169 (+) comp17102_c0_seq1:1743-2249(+)